MPKYDKPSPMSDFACPFCQYNPLISDCKETEVEQIAWARLNAHLLWHAIQELRQLNLAK
jgi:hypothetical protein